MREIIDRILELESKASEGNWEYKRWCDRAWIQSPDEYVFPDGDKDYPANFSNQNVDFICEVRNNIKPLLLRMKALEEVEE